MNRLIMRNAPPILSHRLFLAMIALAASWPVCWAQNPSVQTIDYQNGALCIRSSSAIEAPQTEAWPGTIGTNATELVILSFPHATADFAALQQMGDQLIVKNPELKRYLVSPLDSNKKDNGFQIVVEIAIPPNSDVYTPTASQLQPNQWIIGLKPNAYFSTAASSQNSSASQTTTKQPAAPQSLPQSAISVPTSNGSDPHLLHTIQDLQTQITQLNSALQASTSKQQALQDQLAQYSDFIRPYQPEFNGQKEDTATIQNLRLALVKVAEKLKATKAALAEQTGKTKELAQQLATLKQDPSIATDPTLFVQVADEAPQSTKPATETPGAEETAQANSTKPELLQAPPVTSTERIEPIPSLVKTIPLQEKTLQAILRANPKQWQAYVDLSKLYAANGKPSEAESVLIQLLKANPGYAPGYYQLAQLYAQQKRNLEAQAALDTYRRLQPSHTKAVQALRNNQPPNSKPLTSANKT
jgi:tetratricopeptide (TPR) repeat protein